MPGRHQNRSLMQATTGRAPFQPIPPPILSQQWRFVTKQGLVNNPL